MEPVGTGAAIPVLGIHHSVVDVHDSLGASSRQRIPWHVADLGATYDAILGIGWIKEEDPILVHQEAAVVFRASLDTIAVVSGKKQVRRTAEEARDAYALALNAVTATS